eukprot:scaffold169819_cov32-Tisochrysis_lutea.AAC.1
MVKTQVPAGNTSCSRHDLICVVVVANHIIVVCGSGAPSSSDDASRRAIASVHTYTFMETLR